MSHGAKFPSPAQFLRFLQKTAGNLLAAAILLLTSLICESIEFVGRKIVSFVVYTFNVSIAEETRDTHKPRIQAPRPPDIVYRPDTKGNLGRAPDQVINEELTRQYCLSDLSCSSSNSSSCSPEDASRGQKFFRDVFEAQDLIERSYALIRSEFGCLKPELLSEDFQFECFPVGPLSKAEFVEAFLSFKLRDAFPTGRGNFFNFCVDPLEPNRVWFFSRAQMTHRGPLKLGPMMKTLKPVGRAGGHPRTGRATSSVPASAGFSPSPSDSVDEEAPPPLLSVPPQVV